MIPIADIHGSEVIGLAQEARTFLGKFRWCKQIVHEYLAWSVAPVVGVFFFEIIPARDDIDKELWVIVGDLPPAYLVCDNAQTWQEALDAYGCEMMRWVDAVRAGRSIEDLIPVNASPTLAYADMLQKRMEFLKEHLVDVSPETLPMDQ
jgi:hypothetical protein